MEELYKNIENYLNGKLSSSAKQTFEERMANEPEFKEEVGALRIAKDAVQVGIGEKLRENFDLWDNEMPVKKQAKIITFNPKLKAALVAASIFLLSFLFINWYNMSQVYSNDVLAMQRYSETDYNPILRSTHSVDNPLTKGNTAFENNDFNSAIEAYSTITKDDEAFVDAQFMLTKAYFLNNQLDEGLNTVTPLTKSANTLIKEKSEWLQLVILLKKGEEAKGDFATLLNNIAVNKDHSFQKNALNLQQQLDSFWGKLFY